MQKRSAGQDARQACASAVDSTTLTNAETNSRVALYVFFHHIYVICLILFFICRLQTKRTKGQARRNPGSDNYKWVQSSTAQYALWIALFWFCRKRTKQCKAKSRPFSTYNCSDDRCRQMENLCVPKTPGMLLLF